MVFGRASAGVAACLGIVVVLGCMSINLGGRSADESKPCPDDGVLVQEGKVPVRPGSEQVIYYPVAYASPPNLEVQDALGLCDVLEQKETCFRVRFHPNFQTTNASLSWKARGVRGSSPPAVPAGAAPEAAPSTTGLPSAPVPVPAANPQR
jgi:hypothetical protein